MAVFYLETSALVKRYRPETGSPLVHELFDQKQMNEIFVISQLAALEVISSLSRLFLSGVIDKSIYDKAVVKFSDDRTQTPLLIVPLIPSLVADAIRQAPQQGLRAADALHFATIQRVASRAPQEPFYVVNADLELSAACLKDGIAVIDPTQSDADGTLRNIRSG